MADLLLIYPYFNDDHSIFKFPPLGIGYIASYVRQQGFSVEVMDCTFMTEAEAISKARGLNPRVVGIYSMLSMKESAIDLARKLRGCCELMVAGGPLSTVYPEQYLNDFDIVVMNEGEQTVLEILTSLDRRDLSEIKGIAWSKKNGSLGVGERGACLGESGVVVNQSRRYIEPLDSLPFPARDLYDHNSYRQYFRRHHGYTITPMITSRGCPFNCDYCSRPVFGSHYRSRSPANIADEMESINRYGYDRVWIADDIFPLNKKIALAVCDEIIDRDLDISWECLARGDLLNRELALKMKKAGCYRVFFGLESGNDDVLKIMRKHLKVDQARRAVESATSVGIKAGAFFILGYPGESNRTMLDTIRFASSLPLDYISFTVPYPIPGTSLYERLKDRMMADEWERPKGGAVRHTLLYKSEFSMAKLKFGIMKGRVQHSLRRHLGSGYLLAGGPFELLTDAIFRLMR